MFRLLTICFAAVTCRASRRACVLSLRFEPSRPIALAWPCHNGGRSLWTT
jgi:hypothetical protein